MLEQFSEYITKLEGLSTERLDRSADKLVRAEKQNVALLIAHIAEISRRKGELECGYKNMFVYCTRRLRLSEGSVARRLQVANVARRFPQLLVAISENRLSLTVAGMLAPHLREENVEKLLSDCAGMTKREVEIYLAALQPKPVFVPSIRKQPARPSESEPVRLPAHKDLTAAAKPRTFVPLLVRTEPRTGRSGNLLQPANGETFNFRFAAGKEFKRKFERLAEVLGFDNAMTHMAEVLDQAVDIALEKKAPERKLERRLAKERKRVASERESCPGEVSGPDGSGTRADERAPSRYIPSEVRERVHARAGYRCEFQAAEGTRCSARAGLEVDHRRPFAIFGSHEERDLRLLCKRHNNFSAERHYGAAYIRSKIEQGRHRRRFPEVGRR